MLSVQAQPVAENHDEFKAYYEKVLELVVESSKKVVVVGPALVGEMTDSASNNELKELNVLIESITRKYANVRFLNLQSVFLRYLSKLNCSNYIKTKVIRMMVEALFYKNPSKVDKQSKERGLHLTLDGIHLNSTGANMVAEHYAAEISKLF